MSDQIYTFISEDDIVTLMSSSIKDMPRDHVIKWVLALESRLYKQARGALIDNSTYNEPAYCCLGIYDKVVLGNDDAMIRLDDLEGDNALPPDCSGFFDKQQVFFACNDGGEYVVGGETSLNGDEDLYFIFPQLDFPSIARLIRRARPDVFPPKEA